MKRTSFTVKLRNQIGSLAMSCESAAAIDSMQLTEREFVQKKLREALSYIDGKIF